jgi:hypothetical protein
MRDVRLRLDLQVILVLCLLVPVFLQDHVTSYDGGEPSMCKHGKVYKVSLYLIYS